MEDEKSIMNIPKFYEDKRIIEKIRRWKEGDRSKYLRGRIMKTYWRNKCGAAFLLPSTIEYIERHVKPLIGQAQYRNWKVRFKKKLIKEFLNEKNISS